MNKKTNKKKLTTLKRLVIALMGGGCDEMGTGVDIKIIIITYVANVGF